LRRLLLFFLLTLLPMGSHGGVLRVPEDVNRVSTALLLASPYDTILVAPGVYNENLVWPAKEGIKLLSEEGPEATILDGRGRGQVIGVYTGVDSTTVVRGFTIRNGHAEGM
jgi:hypothetical protein